MVRYLLRRLLYIVFVFLIVSVLLFGIYKLMPGDPARMMLDSTIANTDPVRYQAMYEAARERLGLNDPIPIQYVKWIGNMLTGNFGYSMTYRMDVIDMVAAPMKNTVLLNLASLALVFCITIPLGIATAVRKNSAFDNAVQVGTIVGYSLPSFIIALTLIFLLAVKLPLFPISGVSTAGFEGNAFEKALDVLYHMCLPLLVLVLSSIGGLTRYVRAAMIDALRMDYIRTARAKGLREKVVIYSHAFRNALIPIVTIITGWFVGVFGGSVVIETIFMWNGIGKVLIDALRQQDFPVVLAMQMFYVVLTLAGNLLMDLGYCLVDPRVKLD